MKGTWTGYYVYKSEVMQRAVGHKKTGFTFDIHIFDGTNFEGTVTDDTAIGGMEGTGRIVGTVSGNTINLQKFMPEGSLVDENGNHIPTHKKHDTLYYSGTLTKEGGFAGTWKFKNKISFLFGFIPLPYSPGSGMWQIEKA